MKNTGHSKVCQKTLIAVLSVLLALFVALSAVLVACVLKEDGDGISRKPYLTRYEPLAEKKLEPGEDTLGGTTENTVAHWKFNEGNGSLVHDETGRHNGVVVNGGKDCWVKSTNGNALDFRTNRMQYVLVEDSPALTPMELTIEAIVKFDAVSRYVMYQQLVFKDFAYKIYFVTENDTPYLCFGLDTETNTDWLVAKVRLNGEVFDGKYHHIAFCYDGATGLTRGYFDYWCEDSTYLAPGILMPAMQNYPLYIGAGYWANYIQEASTSTFDELRISSKALYAYDFLGSETETDNWLEEYGPSSPADRSVYSSEHDLQEAHVVGGKRDGEDEEYSVEMDRSSFTSGSITAQVVVTLDSSDKPDGKSRLDGTILYKDADFGIWTYCYTKADGSKGDIVTFRINAYHGESVIDDRGKATVEGIDLYDGQPHHLALVYDGKAGMLYGYVDYVCLTQKSCFEFEDYRYRPSDSPVLFGQSVLGGEHGNWTGNGIYSRLVLTDGVVAVEDMYGYTPRSSVPEAGNCVGQYRFSEVGGAFSADVSGTKNNLILLGGASLEKDGDRNVLNVGKEGADAARIADAPSLHSASLSAVFEFKLGKNTTYGLHRLLFKDFSYDICLDVKSGGLRLSSKINTLYGGWITRLAGDASALADGEYHQIALIFDSTAHTARLYLDGETIAEARVLGGIIESSEDIHLGAGYWANALQQGACGRFADFRLYNYAISEEMI